MKKRILTMLLSALLVANISACNYVPENEIEGTFENIDTTESNFEKTDKKITESETNTETIPTTWEGAITCNGVYQNSAITYTVNQNNDFIIHLADWNEDHLLTSFSAKDIRNSKYSAIAIGINRERAFFLRYRYYENKITVVSFEKGSTSETVVNLDVDEDVYEIGGNFINENVGYIFVFKEVPEGSRGSSKLSNLFKTEDGGNTWTSINVQSAPSISLRNDIEFAKMVSENTGLISGGIGPADYDFCKRTLLTTTGGLNWINVNIPELPENDDLHWALVTDFTQVDKSYILTIRYETPEGNYDYAKYKLLDTDTWIRIN